MDGRIEAVSQDDAVNKLNEMGLVAVSVVEGQIRERKKPDIKPSVVYPGFIKIRARDIDIFTLQLYSLIRAGVPVLNALSLIFQQTENKMVAAMISNLEKQIKDGKMLSEAISGYPRLFNNLYINMVKSGEKSGALDEVLYELTKHRQKEEEIRQKIQAALAYPVLIAIVGVSTVFIMLTFFMPKLIVLFENMEQTLPFSTKVLIGVSKFMANNWYFFLFALIFIFVIFGRLRPGSKKKLLLDFVKLHLPLMKRFIRDNETARFARTLSLLIQNGISVCDGLTLSADVLDNDALREQLKEVRNDVVSQGCALSQSLKKLKIFPAFAVNMISVGEEAGKLDDSLKTIAEVYEGQTEQAIKIMTALLEPLLILTMGAIVGFIVFAMLLPIFNIGVAVH